ncbi:SIMPL domain-containing protein [Pseudalkalibacillus sp. Hm43]|uniref:SIMPL domain-containing protein n=1 Tax=Pseudalkalibacillus sp. Hm43 TaxID=3450742 RepID=UPI003F43E882
MYPYQTPANQLLHLSHVMEMYGEGTIKADPDQIYMTIGVQTENEDVKQATTENAYRATQVLKALQNIGVPTNQIETTEYNIQPIYQYEDGKSNLKGFRVEHLYRIRLNQMNMAGEVYDTAIQAGANVARGLSFELSNPSDYYCVALQKAYEDALGKACSLANVMGVRMTKNPLKVQEQPASRNGIPYKTELLQAATTPIQPQRVTVQAILKVWFCYQ